LLCHLGLAAPAPPSGPACPDASGITSKWDLWRFGTCLRGANIWQKAVDPRTDGLIFGAGPVGPPYSSESLRALASLGANYVDISGPGFFREGAPFTLDRGVRGAWKQLIRKAEKANLFVVVSFRTGPGRSEASFSPSARPVSSSVWESADAQAAWVRMWRQAAVTLKRYRNVVGYDLMVEPNANQIFFHAWDPASFFALHRGSRYDWNPLAAKIAAAIREVDADTPILIGAMDASNPAWLASLAPSGVPHTVYTVHQYSPGNYTGLGHPRSPFSYPGRFEPDGNGTVAAIDKPWLRRLLQPVARFRDSRGAPVAINEFGVMRWEIGAATFLRDELALFEELGVNHAVWLWESDSPRIDYDAFNFRHGPDRASRADVPDNPLIRVLKEDWSRNRITPSSVTRKRGWR
jgi:hypothetical protein